MAEQPNNVKSSPASEPSTGFAYRHGDRPLEGYTIRHALGRGGFGEVYYAVSDAGREVALKCIQGYEQIELRGVSQCMNFKSPHLVTIFDVRYNEHRKPFVIMEYVSGPSLRELIDQSDGGLGAQKAAFFLKEIAKGLTYLHDCGVVHRDLKPANVFFEDGYVKIGDYGLSKAMAPSAYSGQTVTVGTVHYMAPEIGKGSYGRSIDIYALGVVLYEMLTGRLPYAGSSITEVLMRHLSDEPDLSGIDEPFHSAIAKAMAKDPTQRYQHVGEMVDDVMGAADVRNSVYSLRPGDLSMVAGRVAGDVERAPSGDPDAPGGADARRGEGSPDDNGRPGREAGGGAEQVGRDGQEAAGSGEQAGDWASRLGDRIAAALSGDPSGVHRHAEKRRQAGKRRDEDPTPTVGADGASYITKEIDPLAVSTRVWLALACAATAVVAAALSNDVVNPLGVGFVMVLGICGGMAGVMFAHGRFDLKGESPMLWRLAYGGLACIGLMVPSLVVASSLGSGDLGLRRASHHDEFLSSLIAAGLSMFLVNWRKATDPKRKDRASLLQAAWAGVAGAILGLFTDADDFLFLSALMAGATTLGAQLLVPQRRARRSVRVEPPADGRATRSEGLGGATAHDAARSPSPEGKLTCLICAAMGVVGVCGIQRLAVGKVWSGLLYLFTFGLVGIGQVYDVILILAGLFTDAQGRPVVRWDPPEPTSAREHGLSGSMAGGNASGAYAAARAVWRLGSILLSLVGVLGMLGGLAIGMVWATRLPWIARGTHGYELAHVNPRLVEQVLQLAMGLAMLLSAVLLTIARRGRGPKAVFRAMGGVGLMVLAVVILSAALGPIDGPFLDAVAERVNLGDKEGAFELYLSRFDGWVALGAGISALAGGFLLSWTPARDGYDAAPAVAARDGRPTSPR